MTSNFAAQRAHFVQVARACGAPAHALVLHVPTAELQRRVRERTDHPAKVMGEGGARMAARSAAQLELPRHAEGFAAVTRAHAAGPRAEPDAADDSGWTPLILGAYCGQTEASEALPGRYPVPFMLEH